MGGRLFSAAGANPDWDAPGVASLLESRTFFWLDLDAVDNTVVSLFRDVFRFHPLAVEDAEHFGQRPKIEEYDDFVYLVVFGAASGAGREPLVEVHCFYSERFLVTVHRGPCPVLDEVASRFVERRSPTVVPGIVLHRVVDGLVDSFFPVLAKLDDQIDELEDRILEQPTEDQLGELFDLKRGLVAMRKVVTPERDMFAAVVGRATELPGIDASTERYFRDIYDHLIRISDLVDSYRDLLSGTMDTHLSTVSNRLNVVMKQLTIIATVFLPLSFLTGFFGQNFGWMVNRIQSLPVFMVAGLGLQIATVVVLLSLFRRRGWL